MEIRFDEILKIEGNPPSQKKIFDKRMNRINEAKRWPVGTFQNKEYHFIWRNGVFSVGLGKPGKESTRDSGYTGELNPYDMRPDLFKNDENINIAATFGDVVEELEQVAKVEKYCVELLGVLMFRSAFLLDHKAETDELGNTVYRYKPNMEVVDYISSRIPSIAGVSLEAFLQYLDAIALNEDVKYEFKGKNLSVDNTGGKNNYLTYVMIIGVITGDLPISSIAQKLLKTNVSAITIKDAMRILPHVKGQ